MRKVYSSGRRDVVHADCAPKNLHRRLHTTAGERKEPIECIMHAGCAHICVYIEQFMCGMRRRASSGGEGDGDDNVCVLD